MARLFFIPTKDKKEPPFLHVSVSLDPSLVTSKTAILVLGDLMILSFISLMISDDNHTYRPFVCFPLRNICSLSYGLFVIYFHSLGLFVLLSFIYILGLNSLSNVWFEDIFSIVCFIQLLVSFAMKTFSFM